MKKIYPPYGYKISTEKGYVDADNEKEVLKLCLGLSKNKKFLEGVRKATHEERLKNLTRNGFEIREE